MNLTTLPLLKANKEKIKGMYILKTEGGYNLVVKLKEYPDSAVCTTRNPFTARVYRTIGAAANHAASLGFTNTEVHLNAV